MAKELALSPQGERLRALTLERLFNMAEGFGTVRIHGNRGERPPECYMCAIQFDSIPGTSVEAKSEFNRSLPESLIEAIDRAERIVEAYK